MVRSLSLLLLIGILGCSEEQVSEPINISGNWSVIKAYQNEVDITYNFDFSSFNLALNYNETTPSTYSIASDRKIPFITKQTEGNWALDDTLNPSEIRFDQGGITLAGKFAEPLFSTGNTTIVIEFSLGCSEITYTYHLVKN